MPGLIRITTGLAGLPEGTDIIASCTDLNWPLPSRATVMLIWSFGAPEGLQAKLCETLCLLCASVVKIPKAQFTPETQRTTQAAQRIFIAFQTTLSILHQALSNPVSFR